MVLELASQHFAEFGPRHQRGQGDVGGDEAFAVVMHELQQVGLLLVVDGHLAMAHEEDGVDVAEAGAAAGGLAGGHQRLVRCDVGIGADVGVPEAGFVAEALDGGQRVGDRVVLGDAVARVGPGQHYLAARALAAAASTATLPPAARRRGLLRHEQSEATTEANGEQSKSRSLHGDPPGWPTSGRSRLSRVLVQPKGFTVASR